MEVESVLQFLKDKTLLVTGATGFLAKTYVCGETGGLIEENPYRMGQTLNGTTALDTDAEVQVVEEKLNEHRAGGATQESITLAMRDLGTERAMKYGWPNTYVFTKAMGEMFNGTVKTSFPVVISRPTVVTSTWKEPFPGRVKGLGTIDSMFIGYGEGKITFFLADLEGVVDLMFHFKAIIPLVIKNNLQQQDIKKRYE